MVISCLFGNLVIGELAQHLPERSKRKQCGIPLVVGAGEEKAPTSRQSLDDYMGVLEKSVCVSPVGNTLTFVRTHHTHFKSSTHTHTHTLLHLSLHTLAHTHSL